MLNLRAAWTTYETLSYNTNSIKTNENLWDSSKGLQTIKQAGVPDAGAVTMRVGRTSLMR